jgi:hypothetical protein
MQTPMFSAASSPAAGCAHGRRVDIHCAAMICFRYQRARLRDRSGENNQCSEVGSLPGVTHLFTIGITAGPEDVRPTGTNGSHQRSLQNDAKGDLDSLIHPGRLKRTGGQTIAFQP